MSDFYSRDVTTSPEIESQQAKITGSAKVFDILCEKIYSDLPKGVVREIISNAEEARRSVGSETPTEITMPTEASSFFVVRDYGPGMSKEFIFDKFMHMAYTEKEDHFGLGAHIVFGFASASVLECYQNGTKSSYALNKDVGSIPTCNFLGATPTEEADGCKFSIPVDVYSRLHVRNNIIKHIILPIIRY